jgi:hypothetical protein
LYCDGIGVVCTRWDEKLVLVAVLGGEVSHDGISSAYSQSNLICPYFLIYLALYRPFLS